MKKGWLIIFEGIDGVGKTTQVKKLAAYLRLLGWPVVETREPTDGPYGRKIRSLYTSRGTVTREEELTLFIEDRRQHVRDCIQPALDQGAVVISDRYYYSTAAYQGVAGADPEEIFYRNRFAPVPDVVFVLTMNAVQSVQRIREIRGESLNDFEQLEQLEKVGALFASFSQPELARINADGPIDLVRDRILEELRRRTPLLQSPEKSPNIT